MTIRLFVNLYHAGDPKRDAELTFCFLRNRTSGHFAEVVNVPGRPTFNDFFASTRANGTDSINVIANSDIFFDGTIGHVRDYYAKGGKAVMALSRWDVKDEQGDAELWDHRDSQDVWIFPGPVAMVPGADFELGRPGCDNRIARLLQDAGHEVINPARTVKAYHYHLSGVRSYGKGRGKAKVGVVPGPYAFVEPTEMPKP